MTEEGGTYAPILVTEKPAHALPGVPPTARVRYVPHKLGRYDIIRTLGQGAMGVVYEGRDPTLDRRVAIKTVMVDNMPEEATLEYEARFRTEARSAARLQHPHVVSVYDSDQDQGVAFLVMEFVQGKDLKQELDNGVRYSLAQAVNIMQDLLSALDYAHRHNVVHRDVKPANLLVQPDGRVKLADFGVARIQDSGELTRTQAGVVGTLKYSAPEQIKGLRVDHRADLFSAGVVLYQLLTGQRAFDGDSFFSISQAILNTDPPPPSSVNPLLPTAIDAVLVKALAKNAPDRYNSASDFSLELQAAAAQAPQTAGLLTPSWVERAAAWDTPQAALPSAKTDGEYTATLVGQELDLVYWKDVKDSQDPRELESYVQRFPQGVYLDLAHKRIERLRAGASDEGSYGNYTQTQAAVAPPEAAGQQPRVPAQPAPKRRMVAAAAAATLALAAVGAWVALSKPTTATPQAAAAPVAAPASKGLASANLPNASKAAQGEASGSIRKTDEPSQSVAARPNLPAQKNSSPKTACQDRMLLSYQICLSRECAKPAFRSHSVCVERREMERKSQDAANQR